MESGLFCLAEFTGETTMRGIISKTRGKKMKYAELIEIRAELKKNFTKKLEITRNPIKKRP